MKWSKRPARGAPKSGRACQRGSALLMVLAVLAILSVLGLTFAMLARLDRRAGGNFADNVTTRIVAPSSGLDFLTAVLEIDGALPGGGQYAWYDGIDDAHAWLAGVILGGAGDAIP